MESLIKEKIAKLIDVKSIITVILTVLFCLLAWRGIIDGNAVNTIFTTVIAFYFGTQYQKTNNEKEENREDITNSK